MHRISRAAFMLFACSAATLGGACTDARSGRADGGADTVHVAVAANFASAHDTLAQRFRTATGIVIVSVVGATGQLYAQITNGAPIDAFLSADRERPAALERDGAAVAGSRFTYAEGRLAIYAPKSSAPIDTPEKLAAQSIRHIAIANPETAPYGAAAMDVLNHWGISERVKTRIVRGESIAQTFQFVESGAADAAFVALSQVIGQPRERYWLVPATLHAPIAQDAVLLKRASGSAAAKRYLAFLRSADARAVIASFGYTAPDSTGGPPP